MPPAAIIAVGAGAALAGGYLAYKGAEDQAEATGNAARAQQQQAQADRQLAMSLAQPTTAELERLQKQIQLADGAISRQEKILDAVDPALMEAGRQALQLMRGQEATVLSPLKQQRQLQRDQLVNNLRQQMGPGAETSTPGVTALNQFDQETGLLLADAQQKSLHELLGTAERARPNPADSLKYNDSVYAMMRKPQEDAISALTKTPVTPYAGAPFVQAALEGQAQQNFGGTIANLGATMIGNGIGRVGMGTTGTPNSGTINNYYMGQPAQ